jgi:hypothetical protein
MTRIALLGALAAVVAVAPDAACAASYRAPPLRAPFQYQLQPVSGHAATGGVDVGVCEAPASGGPCVRPRVWGIDLYARDGVTPNRSAVEAIHARGGYVLCYVDAGSIERYRPDWPAFRRWHLRHGRSLLGNPYSRRFPDERYANLDNGRGQRDFLLRMHAKRVEKCRRAGFDAVDFDVVDSYAAGRSVTGWGISYATQLTFNRALARLAHRNGMAVALKADEGQVRDLVGDFDMAVAEGCFQHAFCDRLVPFVSAGKPVFEIEYELAPGAFCDRAARLGFNATKKSGDQALLALPWTPCR